MTLLFAQLKGKKIKEVLRQLQKTILTIVTGPNHSHNGRHVCLHYAYLLRLCLRDERVMTR